MPIIVGRFFSLNFFSYSCHIQKYFLFSCCFLIFKFFCYQITAICQRQEIYAYDRIRVHRSKEEWPMNDSKKTQTKRNEWLKPCSIARTRWSIVYSTHLYNVQCIYALTNTFSPALLTVCDHNVSRFICNISKNRHSIVCFPLPSRHAVLVVRFVNTIW